MEQHESVPCSGLGANCTLGDRAERGTALCPVSWAIPWAAARLLLSLRPGQA